MANTRLPLHSAALLLAALPAETARAQDSAFVRDQVLGKTAWRELGPTNFGGRIVGFAVDPSRRSTWYVATATGGVFKTTNNGTSFRPLFQHRSTFSIGAIAIAPSEPSVLYVGTGEANNQRSSYWGDGVHKSTDGGKTWTHIGLDGTDHIGRIVVHPTDPDVVWVAAAGALYHANHERGLFRTRDGGKTWKCVKFIDDRVGFIDIAIDPRHPDVLYAASYERLRRPYDFDGSGPGSAIWKTEDGGDTWKKLGGGLPEGEIGRIGLAVYPGNPKILYASIENANPKAPAVKAERITTGGGDRDPDEAPAAPAPKSIGGEVYRSDDAGATWTKTSPDSKSIGGRPAYYYGQIRVDPTDDQRLYVPSVPLYRSTDGGKTWKADTARGLHSDHHALWIDPTDPDHMLLGNDGGLAVTWDRGSTWDYVNQLPIGQFYSIGVDLREPYWIYGGTQDNGTWGVPSCGPTSRGIGQAEAWKINSGDGFCVCVDPADPDVIYSESQFGAITRQNLATGERKGIRPRARRGSPKLRFNWMSPIALSPHNPWTVYFGSQYLHRSRDRGDTWETISGDLTTGDADKIAGNVPHCTITTISESPRRAGLLWVGTDDGKVWVSRNGGGRWVDLSDRFPGLPKPLWVSRVEASPSDADIAYVAFTGYREDIREPFLYLTTDGGETFRSIANNLPRQPINVIREHPRNPDVLFAGTENGCYASLDAGASWQPIGKGLPTTPVHDLLVHPRDNDLVIGTHGRGLWALDITALGELNRDVLAESFHAFAARDATLLPRGFGQGYDGARGWRAANPEAGAVFRYYLSEDSDKDVEISVLDAKGTVYDEQKGKATAGLHELVWNPRGRGQRGPRGQRGRRQRRPRAEPGQYVVRFTHGDTTVERPFWVR